MVRRACHWFSYFFVMCYLLLLLLLLGISAAS